jgi:hypothetical protein
MVVQSILKMLIYQLSYHTLNQVNQLQMEVLYKLYVMLLVFNLINNAKLI